MERLRNTRTEQNGELSDSELKEIWEGQEQGGCVSICERLRAANIPFNVAQCREQLSDRLDTSFKIAVPAEFYDQAKQIAEEGNSDFNEDDPNMELPADDRVAELPEDRNSNRGPWYPEDATVEVWSEDVREKSWIIELSLKSNYIPFRVEQMESGPRKIFVTPEDESAAREIVHEIRDGAPPQ